MQSVTHLDGEQCLLVGCSRDDTYFLELQMKEHQKVDNVAPIITVQYGKRVRSPVKHNRIN